MLPRTAGVVVGAMGVFSAVALAVVRRRSALTDRRDDSAPVDNVIRRVQTPSPLGRHLRAEWLVKVLHIASPSRPTQKCPANVTVVRTKNDCKAKSSGARCPSPRTNALSRVS